MIVLGTENALKVARSFTSSNSRRKFDSRFASFIRMMWTPAQRFLPIGDDIGHRRIGWVDRLNDGEPFGRAPAHFHRTAWRRSGTGKRRR
jgi:hypothetical protein